MRGGVPLSTEMGPHSETASIILQDDGQTTFSSNTLFRALSGRLKFMVRRQRFDKDSLSIELLDPSFHKLGVLAGTTYAVACVKWCPLQWIPLKWCSLKWCLITWCPLEWCPAKCCPITWCFLTWWPKTWCFLKSSLLKWIPARQALTT